MIFACSDTIGGETGLHASGDVPLLKPMYLRAYQLALGSSFWSTLAMGISLCTYCCSVMQSKNEPLPCEQEGASL